MGGSVATPCYVVLEIPEPMATKIRRFRRLFDKSRAKLPIEITLTGSCGLGLISKGQDFDGIFALVDKVAAAEPPFDVAFEDKVESFNSSDTFYLGFRNTEPFKRLHKAMAESGIHFDPSPYPYTPHCTIKLRSKPKDEELFDLFFLKPPAGYFKLDTISVYSLTTPLSPLLLHSVKLGQKPETGN